MKSIKVSILVPVYGVEAFVEKCARSLFEQTYSNLEFIFVNDCTRDRSMEIIERTLIEYPMRREQYNRIDHSENSGIAVVRNTLLQRATGDYFIFIDSDDWIDRSMIQQLVEKVERDDSEIAICQYYKVFEHHKQVIRETLSMDPVQRLKDMIALKTSAMLWKMLIQIKFRSTIRFVSGINVAEDYIYCVKLFYQASCISLVDEPLYYYIQLNQHNYSKLSEKNIEDRLRAIGEIERYSKEQGFYEQVIKEINGRKFIIKKVFLLDPQYRDYKRWSETYPECDQSWRQFPFRFDYKLIFWLAERHYFRGLDFLFKIKHLSVYSNAVNGLQQSEDHF